MPITLQDLYAQPMFIEKVEQPIKAEIMSWTFETENPKAINPSEVPPIAVSLGTVRFSGEDEERIQGETVVSSRIAVSAQITTQVQTADQQTGMTEDITQELKGFMNFSLPWGWQAKELNFVTESAKVKLNRLLPA
ncbi:MAG TPA: hypothetical protein VIS71_11565 [Terrimicrobium sp.]